ncbi:MAG: MbnP family protein, partial [Chloroflexota bacterium]
MSALKKLMVFAGIILFAMISCTDDTEKSGTFKLAFQHYVDGNPLIRDSMMYVNAAENPYEITEIMYFISRVKLYNHNGKVVELNT